jgi:AcrR family transcriptional regulator
MRTVNPVHYAAQEKKILDAAGHLFSEKGYRETGMRDIAVSCGLTKASLYHYFDGKNAILLALLRQRIDALDLGSREVWRAATLRDALEAVANEYFRVVERAGAHEIIAILISEGGKRDGVRDYLRNISRQYEDDFLEGAVGHGLIRPEEEDSLRVALYSFFGALSRYNMDTLFFGKPALKMAKEKYAKYLAALTSIGWRRGPGGLGAKDVIGEVPCSGQPIPLT